jgi:hypothetical protein
MTWLWPSLLGLSRVVQPDTILRWHRAGFRAYWRWKSRGRPGRPRISRELRELIQRMSKENPLWGAPRIHGELLKLGFEIAESTVSKYMIWRRGPPSQTWRTFLRNLLDLRVDICVREHGVRFETPPGKQLQIVGIQREVGSRPRNPNENLLNGSQAARSLRRR